MSRRHVRRAFTLIELLLVLVILAVLAAVVVPRLTGRVENARRGGGTISTMSNIKTALGIFESDLGRYPTTEEGLMFLMENITNDPLYNKGGYLEKWPQDSWGHNFDYKCPGVEFPDSYDLTSSGTDGNPGTDDDIHKNDVY